MSSISTTQSDDNNRPIRRIFKFVYNTRQTNNIECVHNKNKQLNENRSNACELYR